MTYRELAKLIDGMTDEQKDCDVSVYDEELDEFYSLCEGKLYFVREDDLGDGILDLENPFLLF